MPATRANDLALLSREFRPALMTFFLRRVRNHSEAEDLTQEVFARLANGKTEDLTCAKAYVFQVASNLLIDRGRRASTRPHLQQPISQIDEEIVDELDPFRIAAARDSIAAMCAVLGEVNDITRQVFVLYRLEGMDKTALADTFGVSISSIEKHITKATVILTKRFGGEL